MPFFSPLRPLLQGWLISLLGWGFVAGLLGVAMVWDGRGDALDALRMGAADWLPWAVATPLLFRLTMRLPIDRTRWPLAVPVHVCCALVTLVVFHTWKAALLPKSMPATTAAAWRPTEPPDWPDRDRMDGPGRMRGGPGGPNGALGGPNGALRGPNGPFGGPGGPNGFDRPPGPPPEGFGPPPGRPGGHGQGSSWDLFHFLSTDVPLYLMIVCAAHASLFFRREEERSASLVRARLETLHLQLQPHFLFNSLNTVAGLVHDEPDRAETMLLALSDLLRLTLTSPSTPELPLSRELQFVEGYLAIMHTRFEEKLRFQMEIAPEVHAAMIPTFFLQPLVEGAVQQELELNRRAGLITIRAWREASMLHLCVDDHSQPSVESESLVRARLRLQELYGACANLIQRTAEGCTIHITLPFHTTVP